MAVTGQGKHVQAFHWDEETQVPSKSKPYPLKPEEDLFTTQSNARPETLLQSEYKNIVTSVTQIEQVILLHADQTFSIYKQAGKKYNNLSLSLPKMVCIKA